MQKTTVLQYNMVTMPRSLDVTAAAAVFPQDLRGAMNRATRGGLAQPTAVLGGGMV